MASSGELFGGMASSGAAFLGGGFLGGGTLGAFPGSALPRGGGGDREARDGNAAIMMAWPPLDPP